MHLRVRYMVFRACFNFQSSAISNAYTVKSLPGASYLYIPVLDARSVSAVASAKRSLSDPEIHFAAPFGHPIILTVNPSSDNQGTHCLRICRMEKKGRMAGVSAAS